MFFVFINSIIILIIENNNIFAKEESSNEKTPSVKLESFSNDTLWPKQNKSIILEKLTNLEN